MAQLQDCSVWETDKANCITLYSYNCKLIANCVATYMYIPAWLHDLLYNIILHCVLCVLIILQNKTKYVRTYISTTTYTWCYSCQLLYVNEGLCRSCCPPLDCSSHALGTVYTQTSLSREPTNHTTVGPLPQDTGTVQYTAHTDLVCQVIERGLTVLLGIAINYTVATYTHIHNICT